MYSAVNIFKKFKQLISVTIFCRKLLSAFCHLWLFRIKHKSTGRWSRLKGQTAEISAGRIRQLKSVLRQIQCSHLRGGTWAMSQCSPHCTGYRHCSAVSLSQRNSFAVPSTKKIPSRCVSHFSLSLPSRF